ncbi:MAG TPA: F0F1 ATP synthase subunit delta [Bacillales bacterium]|nr:F0F1 ATP synthase subunit delta [Bacillales bacterium]
MSEAAAVRYARALFEVAQEHGNVDGIEADLRDVLQAFQDEGAHRVFLNPRLDAEERKKLIEVFADKVTEEVSNFLKVLVDHHREEELADILNHYTALANEERGVVKAVVTTAFPLTEDEKSKLADQFGKAIDKTVEFEERIDRDIIGGIMIRVGDRIYDGTVSGKLSRFKQNLTQLR